MSTPSSLRGRCLACLLSLAAGAQLVVATLAYWPVAHRIPHDLRLMTEEPPTGLPTEGMHAFAALPELLREVPDDARVLVVSGLAAVQIEFYVLPRPMRLLQVFPLAWLELARQHAPHIAEDVQRRRERLDGRGLLLTAERLRDAVGAAQFVLVAGPVPKELDAVRVHLEPRRERLGFALFAVR